MWTAPGDLHEADAGQTLGEACGLLARDRLVALAAHYERGTVDLVESVNDQFTVEDGHAGFVERIGIHHGDAVARHPSQRGVLGGLGEHLVEDGGHEEFRDTAAPEPST